MEDAKVLRDVAVPSGKVIREEGAIVLGVLWGGDMRNANDDSKVLQQLNKSSDIRGPFKGHRKRNQETSRSGGRS